MDTTLLNRITTDPKILVGKPIIRGMRMSVEQVLKMLARGISHEEIFIHFWQKTISKLVYYMLLLKFLLTQK
jgi:uncharacterized protein (DUF433 family)